MNRQTHISQDRAFFVTENFRQNPIKLQTAGAGHFGNFLAKLVKKVLGFYA